MIRQLVNWVRRDKLEAAFDRELQYHLKSRISDLQASGMPPRRRAGKLCWSLEPSHSGRRRDGTSARVGHWPPGEVAALRCKPFRPAAYCVCRSPACVRDGRGCVDSCTTTLVPRSDGGVTNRVVGTALRQITIQYAARIGCRLLIGPYLANRQLPSCRPVRAGVPGK